MQRYPQEVQAYVEEMVYVLLDSLRNSQQEERRYHALALQGKRATTVQLRELSEKAAEHILANPKDIDELGALDSDALVREELMPSQAMIRSSGAGRVRHSLTLGHRSGRIIQVAENDRARLLLTIGQAVFEFEEASKKSLRSQLEIDVPSDIMHLGRDTSLAMAIERLISFVILSETEISYLPSSDTYQKTIAGLNRNVDAVCLFSGGVDSISGTLLAAEADQNLSAVFCSHLHQRRVISITRRLAKTYLRRQDVDLHEVPAPSMRTTGYSQTRGWLYIMTAAAVAI